MWSSRSWPACVQRWNGTDGRRSTTFEASAATASLRTRGSAGPMRRTTTAATMQKVTRRLNQLRDHDPRGRSRRAPSRSRLQAARRLCRGHRGSLGQSAVESRPRANAALATDVVHVSHRRALDWYERGHHHLYARIGPDAAGNDLVAGDAHDPAG